MHGKKRYIVTFGPGGNKPRRGASPHRVMEVSLQALIARCPRRGIVAGIERTHPDEFDLNPMRGASSSTILQRM